MDTESTDTENTLPDQEAPRKQGTPPTIVMTSTKKLIRVQSGLKDHAKEECEFRNTQYGTRMIKK
jgi:hypothetical protein